jgi:dTDP-4-amino-4,6-dideoxygalactose transaminase
LYPIRVNEPQAKKTQRQIYSGLKENGIAANLHYIPVHRHPYYENLGFRAGDFPEAEKFYRETISLPMYPTLTPNQQEHVIDVLRKLLAS